MTVGARLALGVLVAVLVIGCDDLFGLDHIEPPPAIIVACAQSTDCMNHGASGTCECGYCSYTDSRCQATNRRWAEGAEGALSASCVPALEQIDSHVYHTCGRMTDGSAWCWGWNIEGQLGRSQMMPTDSNVPVRVTSSTGVVANVAEIAAGGTHSCARFEDGTVSCWGGNQYGQLGGGLPTGAGARSLDPVQVVTDTGPLAGVTKIASGFFHMCALVGPSTGTQAIYCWGDNARYQLATSTVPISSRAIPVTTLPAGDIRGLSAGGDDTCAIVDEDGAGPLYPYTYCWGRQADGRLGNGQITDANIATPARV